MGLAWIGRRDALGFGQLHGEVSRGENVAEMAEFSEQNRQSTLALSSRFWYNAVFGNCFHRKVLSNGQEYGKQRKKRTVWHGGCKTIGMPESLNLSSQ